LNRNKQKIALKMSLLLVTLLSLSYVFFSKTPREHIPQDIDLPTSNSVLLVLSKTIDPCRDTDEVCNISEPDILIQEATASGLAISYDDDFTYILTAAHFCDEYYGDFDRLLGVKTLLTAVDIHGNTWVSSVLYQDVRNDLCIVRSRMDIDQNIKMSTSDPEMGERVFAIAYPSGIGGQDVTLHFEGKFSGCNAYNNCYFTMPATFGSSGGVILNSRNEIVGIIQRKPATFDAIAISTSRQTIYDFLLEAEIENNISLIHL